MPLKRHLEGVKMAVRIEEREWIGVAIEAVEAERLRVPRWFGEAVLLGQYWLESGVVGVFGRGSASRASVEYQIIFPFVSNYFSDSRG